MPRLEGIVQGDPLWFSVRTGRITASLAAACLRRDKHKGPLAAYREIMGITTRIANAYMVYGQKHEEDARQAYWIMARELGLCKEIYPGGFWIHDRHDWLGASPDMLLDSDGCGDLKCPQVHLPESLPEAHEIQLRVQMACTNRQWADYYCWREDGWHYYERIHRDLDIERDLIRDLEAYYNAHVLTSIPPRMRARKIETPMEARP